MSNKNGGNDNSNEEFWSNPITTGMALLLIASFLGGRQMTKGYRLGLEVSDRALKRHDKDVRRIEKKVAKEKKEALKEKRREEKLKLKLKMNERGP